jgi:hypothetical protein
MSTLLNFLFTTDFPIDKIVGYQTGSVVVPATSTVFPTFSHTLTYTPLYLIKWSTTPDFSISYDELGVSTINNLAFSAQTDASTTYLFILNNSSSSVTFYYRILYFMPPDVNSYALATAAGLEIFQFNTDYNYTKVFKDDFTTTKTFTYNHGLSYFPQTETWYIRTSDNHCVHCIVGDPSSVSGLPRTDVSDSDLIMRDASPSIVSKWYYRVYVDET